MEENKVEAIECTRSAAWQLAWNNYKSFTFFIIFLNIILFIIIFHRNQTTGSFFVFLQYSALMYIIYYGILWNKAHKEFMLQFAKDNNFIYKKSFPLGELKCLFSNFGHSKKITNSIDGVYDNFKIRLFNYSTTVGHGRNSKKYPFTVFEIFLEKNNLPKIVLQKGKIRDHSSNRKLTEIYLESEFSKNFKLYCEEGYEIETLQIFTPEILIDFKEKNFNSMAELTQDRIYIYKNKYVSKKKDLYELYQTAQIILKAINPTLNRLKKDFNVLHDYYKK